MNKTTKQALIVLIGIFMIIGIVGMNHSTSSNDQPPVLKENQHITISVEGFNRFYYEATYDYEKTNVYDYLVKLCNENQIEIQTKGFGPMIYVSSINHLAEFDEGNRSGWIYHVNGEMPNVGCGSYEVQEGDQIEWIYVTK